MLDKPIVRPGWMTRAGLEKVKSGGDTALSVVLTDLYWIWRSFQARTEEGREREARGWRAGRQAGRPRWPEKEGRKADPPFGLTCGVSSGRRRRFDWRAALGKDGSWRGTYSVHSHHALYMPSARRYHCTVCSTPTPARSAAALRTVCSRTAAPTYARRLPVAATCTVAPRAARIESSGWRQWQRRYQQARRPSALWETPCAAQDLPRPVPTQYIDLVY